MYLLNPICALTIIYMFCILAAISDLKKNQFPEGNDTIIHLFWENSQVPRPLNQPAEEYSSFAQLFSFSSTHDL